MTRLLSRLLALGLLIAALAGTAPAARAHEPTLAVLQLRELGNGSYLGHWLVAPVDQRETLRPIFPDQCAWEPPRLDCQPPGLAGRIGFEGLGSKQSAVLVRVEGLDGAAQSYTLTPVAPTARLFRGARTGWEGWAELVGTYVRSGFDHILRGPDHLLFVLGLIGIVGWTRDLLRTVTAFSVAHSLTLAAAALGFVTPPVAAVNATLALSILFLAPEMVRAWRGEPCLTRRHPWLIAFIFGLLHGFGFATSLTDAGLPAAERPWALLGFNVGVELGQVAFIVLVAALLRAVRQLGFQPPRWAGLVPAYGVGSFGAAWAIGRTAAMIGLLP